MENRIEELKRLLAESELHLQTLISDDPPASASNACSPSVVDTESNSCVVSACVATRGESSVNEPVTDSVRAEDDVCQPVQSTVPAPLDGVLNGSAQVSHSKISAASTAKHQASESVLENGEHLVKCNQQSLMGNLPVEQTLVEDSDTRWEMWREDRLGEDSASRKQYLTRSHTGSLKPTFKQASLGKHSSRSSGVSNTSSVDSSHRSLEPEQKPLARKLVYRPVKRPGSPLRPPDNLPVFREELIGQHSHGLKGSLLLWTNKSHANIDSSEQIRSSPFQPVSKQVKTEAVKTEALSGSSAFKYTEFPKPSYSIHRMQVLSENSSALAGGQPAFAVPQQPALSENIHHTVGDSLLVQRVQQPAAGQRKVSGESGLFSSNHVTPQRPVEPGKVNQRVVHYQEGLEPTIVPRPSREQSSNPKQDKVSNAHKSPVSPNAQQPRKVCPTLPKLGPRLRLQVPTSRMADALQVIDSNPLPLLTPLQWLFIPQSPCPSLLAAVGLEEVVQQVICQDGRVPSSAKTPVSCVGCSADFSPLWYGCNFKNRFLCLTCFTQTHHVQLRRQRNAKIQSAIDRMLAVKVKNRKSSEK